MFCVESIKMIDFTAKKYIKKNIKKKNLAEIATEIGVDEKEILNYLKKIWKKDKFKKFVEKLQITTQTHSVSIKQLFQEYKYFLIFLVGVVFVIYFNSLDNAFVSDDIAGILHNPNIGNLSYVFSDLFYLTNKVIRFSIFHLFGLTPMFYRLVNILAHIGSVILLFFIVAKIINKQVAIYVSLLFAVHPILTESITWVGGSDYALYSLFFLLSFFFYLYKNENKKFYVYSIIFYLLTLVTSEKTFHLFLIFVAFEVCFNTFYINWKKIIPYFVLSTIWAVHYVSALFWRVNAVSDGYAVVKDGGGLNNPLLQIPIAISEYLKLIFWPGGLTIYHSELSFNYIQYIVALLIFLIFLLSTMWLYFKKRKLAFWPILFFISLFPFLTPFKISWLVAERYVYLGSIGIFVLVGVVFNYLENRFKYAKQYVLLIFSLIIFVLSIRTIIRNNDWQNEDTLWIATSYTSPSSSQNHNNLGDVYSRKGDLNRAAKEFETAIKLKPNYADAYHNLANTYKSLGKLDKAIENYNLAIKYKPNLWQSYQNLASIYFYQKNYKLALENLQLAYKINPDINLLNNIGLVYINLGDKTKAKEVFNQVLKVDPNNKNAKQFLNSL